jgi:16S rRNA (uracil1498-N3)-methyltransferase
MRRIVLSMPDPAPAGGPGPHAAGTVVRLPRREARHAREVLRLQEGQVILLADGRGRLWEGKVGQLTATAVTAILTGRAEEAPPPLPVTLAVAMTKKGFDDLIRQAVELGVTRLIPLRTSRTVKGLAPKPERWGRIAAEAAKQSGRAYTLEVSGPVALPAYGTGSRTGGVFVADPGARESLLAAVREAAPPYEIAIGPEGGLAPEETDALARSGFRPVSLSNGTLRTETAAVAAAAVLGEAARRAAENA